MTTQINSKQMLAAQAQGYGLRATIKPKTVSRPQVRPHEVLVEVYASSVNPKDWKLNFPTFAFLPKWVLGKNNITFGDDLSGVIVAVGHRVNQFKVGDAVYGMSMNLRTGSCAQYCVIAETKIALKPKNLTHEQAAVVPLAALSALQMLHKARLKPRQKILIIGASGGVGSFATQLATAMGGIVTGVCSGRHVSLVKALGATQVFDYTQDNYLNTSDAFDIILDTASHQNLIRCRQLLKKGGRYVSSFGNAQSMLSTFLSKIMIRNKRALGLMVHSSTKDLNTLREYIEQSQVKPIIGKTYPLSALDDAYKESRYGKNTGKIGIKIKDENCHHSV